MMDMGQHECKLNQTGALRAEMDSNQLLSGQASWLICIFNRLIEDLATCKADTVTITMLQGMWQ